MRSRSNARVRGTKDGAVAIAVSVIQPPDMLVFTDLRSTPMWMASELAENINNSIEMGQFTCEEAADVLERLAKILRSKCPDS